MVKTLPSKMLKKEESFSSNLIALAIRFFNKPSNIDKRLFTKKVCVYSKRYIS